MARRQISRPFRQCFVAEDSQSGYVSRERAMMPPDIFRADSQLFGQRQPLPRHGIKSPLMGLGAISIAS